MPEKSKSGRDAFTFSLDGLRAIAPFTVAPAIAHDRINKVIDEELRQPREDQPREDQPREDQPTVAAEIGISWGRYWLRALRRTA